MVDLAKAIQLVTKAAQIAHVAGAVLKAGGVAGATLKDGLANAGVEVTEAEWDALEAGFAGIADTARREIAAEK